MAIENLRTNQELIKKVVNNVIMKKILLIILFFTGIRVADAQEVSNDPKSNLAFYAAVFSDRCKTLDTHLPNGFTVNGDMLTYIDEFMAEKSSAPGLKKFIMENDWDFIKKADTTGKIRHREYIEIKKLIPLLSKGITPAKKRSDLFYTFSPIIFSGDKKKAFLVFDTANKGEVLGVVACFFEVRNGKWKLVNSMVPFYI